MTISSTRVDCIADHHSFVGRPAIDIEKLIIELYRRIRTMGGAMTVRDAMTVCRTMTVRVNRTVSRETIITRVEHNIARRTLVIGRLP
jgi:hypothetical protein